MPSPDDLARREAIREEYCKLRDVYLNCVGRLYPSIIYGQLMDLAKRYGEPNDLPFVREPNSYGYAQV